MKFQILRSPLGSLYLVGDATHLHAVIFEKEWEGYLARHLKLQIMPQEGSFPVLQEAAKQLTEYFAGKRREFDIPYRLNGTDFQKKVWTALGSIPYGKTISYKEQALAIKKPKATRAVGGTNGRNLLSIILPCHRVVGSSGRLTGYAGGIAAKEFLLRLEGIRLEASRGVLPS